MYIEEYVPEIKPTKRVKENPFKLGLPKMNKTKTTIIVVKEVITVRERVWFIALFIIVLKFSLGRR